MTSKEFWHVSDPAVVQADPTFKDVIAWLKKHGAPVPTVRKALYPGNLETTECSFAPGVFRATADVVDSPSTVLTELQKEKVAAGDPNVYVPYPDVVPENPVKLPPPHEPLPPAVGLPSPTKQGQWELAEGTSAPAEGQKVKGLDGRMYVGVSEPNPFGLGGKAFHYELAEEEADAPAAPAPHAPIASRVPEFEPPALDLGAILVLLAKYVTPEQFTAILALVAPKPAAPVVAPSVKFLLEDGTEFPNHTFVDQKIARDHGKTVFSGLPGMHISRMTYTNGKANMASPQGQFGTLPDGTQWVKGVQFNFPEYGVISTEAVQYFYGPPSGTDWKPFGPLFETKMINVDAPTQIVTGTPRT